MKEKIDQNLLGMNKVANEQGNEPGRDAIRLPIHQLYPFTAESNLFPEHCSRCSQVVIFDNISNSQQRKPIHRRQKPLLTDLSSNPQFEDEDNDQFGNPETLAPDEIPVVEPATTTERIEVKETVPLSVSLSIISKEQVRWRRIFLSSYEQALKMDAQNNLLREQVAPLNPILAAPPPPNSFYGSKYEFLFETDLALRWMLKTSVFPLITWDISCPISTLRITARPYPYIDPNLNCKEQRKRAPVDNTELLRFFSQAATNPPSTVGVPPPNADNSDRYNLY